MAVPRYSRVLRTIPIIIALFVLSPIRGQAQEGRPVADAGSSRYAGPDPIVLDGTGSYDPDKSGTLSYAWQQISGPSVVIIDANTATPIIAGSTVLSGRVPTPMPQGFAQTDAIQECEFELLVNDGELTSLPDVVKVIIVPDFGLNSFRQQNPPYDANKPTLVYFGGGDCTSGLAVDGWSPFTPDAWDSNANIIYFPDGYTPDSGGGRRTYYKYGDMIIVYLSAVAPDYKQPIQTVGWSTGGQPAADVGIHLNLIYADARYAVNRVTFFDAIRYCRADYTESISTFLGSSVDGEQCWADAYVSATSGGDVFVGGSLPFQENVLNVGFPNATGGWYQRHILASGWYANSVVLAEMNNFNHGVVAGAYWSVIGPGKNLQLASTPGEQTYRFSWYGDKSSGYMDFYDEPNHPGRLPEPVRLVAPQDGAVIDANGAVFSCEESENAVGYQLLFGSDPYRITDYLVISDTPNPPAQGISEFPFEKTWWTVKAYDSFGSTIYADPRCINAMVVSPPPTLPDVLYIYNNDIEAAESFQSLLVDYGCPTTSIRVADVPATPLDAYDLVIVANDTRYETTWSDPNAVAAIEDSGKPVVGLGDGGYDFFGLLGLSIGNPYGGHGSKNSIEVINPNSLLFSMPYSIEIPQDRVLQPYTETRHVGIYLWPTIPETVTALGREVNDPGYYPLALEFNRYLLWGFEGSPEAMTEIGKRLFINVVIHAANATWEVEIY